MNAKPQPGPSPSGPRRWPGWRWVRRLGLAVFLGVVVHLVGQQARQMDWSQVLHSLRAYPPRTLAACAGLAAASLLLISSFDLLGRHDTGHGLPVRQVMAVGFTSHVFNLNLGALIGGVGFRLRLYTRLGLELGMVARVLALSVLTSWLGYLLLAGSLFALNPQALALPPSWKIDTSGLRWLGAAMVALALAYLGLCGFSRRREFRWRRHTVRLPSARLAWLQAALGLGNWLLLGTLVSLLMPPGLETASVFTVLLLAAVAGVLAHVPAGLGVLEAVFITLLGQSAPAHALLAALLAYRLLYYLVPLGLGLIFYLGLEARARPASAQLIKPPAK